MNFFGHTVIAARVSHHPSFLLGSMVPDFATMSGTRLDAPPESNTTPPLRDGVAVHHMTDDVFHATADFLYFNRHIRTELESLDVPRGASMAVGHIGAELLLDRAFIELGEGSFYLAAIEHACEPTDPVGIHYMRGDKGKARYRRLISRLQSFGTEGYTVPVIVDRVERVLRGRKRLAIPPNKRSHVANVLTQYAAPIAERAISWRADIESQLASHAKVSTIHTWPAR